MTDPFDQSKNTRQFIREAQIGLLIIALLVGYFAYVAYYRIEKYKSQLPQYVVEAPIAELVDPHTYLQRLQANQSPIQANGQNGQDEDVPADRRFSQPHEVAKTTEPTALPAPIISKSPAIIANTSEDNSKTKKPTGSIYDNQLRSLNNAGDESFVAQATRNEPILSPESQGGSGNKASQTAYDIVNEIKFLPHELTPVLCVGKASEEPKNATVDDDSSFQPSARSIPPRNQDAAGTGQPEPDDFTKSSVSPMTLNMEADPLETETSAADLIAKPLLANANSRTSGSQPVIGQRVPGRDASKNSTVESPTMEGFDAQTNGITGQPSNSPGKYIVKHGDSYWSIAQELYGDGRFFRALFEHNRSRLVEFENLDAGTEINAPAVDLLIIRYPDLCPPDRVNARQRAETTNVNSHLVYETRQGDTLFDVARKQLGQASRYLEILQLNNQQLPSNINHLTKLRAGIKLDLPQ